MKISLRFHAAFAKSILLGLGCLLACGEVFAQDGRLDFFSPVANGKALKWTPSGNGKVYLLQPTIVVIAETPSGEMQLGFNHFGYTANSGNKRASLLVTVDVKSPALTAAERGQLESDGFSFWDASASTGRVELDVTLPADVNEQTRLRSALKLPRVFTPGTLQLLNIEWAGVPGKVLYSWLTEPNGLRVVLRGVGSATVEALGTVDINGAEFDAWWSRSVGRQDRRLFWTGGESALAYDLLGAGTVKAMMQAKPFTLNNSSASALKLISAQIKQLATLEPNGDMSISYAELRKAAVGTSDRFQVSVVFPLSSFVAPGEVLRIHPEYVIDQSSGVAGLEALLHDH